jgi:hypothetical protein
MTYDKMQEIGGISKNMEWSDEELAEQIEALNLVIAYFEGRGDAALMLRPLRLELRSFEDMLYFRK